MTSVQAELQDNVAGFPVLGRRDNDPMSNVFVLGSVTYRGILEAEAHTVRALFEAGVVDELVSEGLMTPAKLIDPGPGGYAQAIELPELTPPNHTGELPPSMRRDAGIALLRIARILARKGFAIQDADLSGFIVGQHGQPLFHNLTAVLPDNGRKFPYSEFHANFLGPLRLTCKRPELADLVQRAGTIGPDEDMSIRHSRTRGFLRWIGRHGGVFGRRIFTLYYRLAVQSPYGALLHTGRFGSFLFEAVYELMQRSRIKGASRAQWTSRLLDDLEKSLARLDFEQVSQKWTDYHQKVDLPGIVRAGDQWKTHYEGGREQALIGVLSDVECGSLLDIGANGGYFSMLGAHMGFSTTAADYDIGAIDKLYRLLKDAGWPLPIRPLTVDFVRLERQHWLRFQADVVFALGFVHHMRLVELLPWAVVAEQLSGLTRKILVTEFKPGTGASGSKQGLTESVVNDYDLASLVAALDVHFDSVEVLGDFTAVGSQSPRTMIVCRRK